jgi:hypothetical protein
MAVTGQGIGVFGFNPVKLGTLRQHFFDTEYHRTVGVTFLLAFCVVFAVYRRPFFGDLARGQPQPATKKMRWNGVKVQRTVGLMSVQVNRDTGNGDVGEHQGDQHDLPPSGRYQPMGQPMHHRIQKIHGVTFNKTKSQPTGQLLNFRGINPAPPPGKNRRETKPQALSRPVIARAK